MWFSPAGGEFELLFCHVDLLNSQREMNGQNHWGDFALTSMPTYVFAFPFVSCELCLFSNYAAYEKLGNTLVATLLTFCSCPVTLLWVALLIYFHFIKLTQLSVSPNTTSVTAAHWAPVWEQPTIQTLISPCSVCPLSLHGTWSTRQRLGSVFSLGGFVGQTALTKQDTAVKIAPIPRLVHIFLLQKVTLVMCLSMNVSTFEFYLMLCNSIF